MTPAELVEETARALFERAKHSEPDALSPDIGWPGLARAALAVALEACAKVADQFESDADPDAGAAMAAAIGSLLPPRSE